MRNHCSSAIQAQDVAVAGIKNYVRTENALEIIYTGLLKGADTLLIPFEQAAGVSSTYIIPLDGLSSASQKFSLAEASGNGNNQESANRLLNGQSHDPIQAGTRLILHYNVQDNAFYDTIQNIANTVLRRVHVEIYLSNEAELKTTPMDLEPGKSANLLLPATDRPFDTWRAHVDREDGRD